MKETKTVVGGRGVEGKRAHPRYTTTAELARRWQVSVITIHRLIDQGDLAGLKIRGRYRICRQSVERYEDRVSF